MPELLGPTIPVPGYDNPPVKITTAPPTDTAIQNIVNTQQVVRADGKTEQQDAGDAALSARFESNFMSFLQRLQNAPDLQATFLRVLQGRGLQVSSGIQSGFAEQLSEFLNFLKMDESRLLPFLKNQMQSGARFGGALFQLLRGAYAGTRSEVVRGDILNFLRKYSDFTSTEHLEGKLVRTLSEMAGAVPPRWGDQLTELLAKLENGVAAGDRAGNLELLRDKVISLVSQYVSLTHDHGRARNLLSMMTLDMARYENGAPQGVLQALRHLSASGALPEELNELSDAELLHMLQDTDFHRASEEDAFAPKLANMMNQALRGQAGLPAQDAFRDILSAYLVNESVYMPLNHIMLPLDWNGKLMFSELWVDPDARNEQKMEGGVLRLLLKLDIQDVGAFDLVLDHLAGDVTLQVACPESVAAFSDQVSQALSGILERNGFRPREVSVRQMKRPIAVSEAFPKIFEGVNSVNVKA